MKFISLSSGSKGNCSLVITNNSIIMIDIGVSYTYLVKELDKLKLTPLDIDYVLITHIHSDHTKGLKQFVNKTKKKVYIPDKMVNELTSIVNIDNITVINDLSKLDDVYIELIYTSHDTECSVGYIISSNNKSLVYITDTGYIPNQEHPYLKNADYYIFESNHDMNMLMNSNRPMYLKQRILGDCGHMCNEDATHYLMNFIGPNTKHVVLAHISDECNTPEIAQNVFINALKQVMWPYQITIKAMPQRTRYSIND